VREEKQGASQEPQRGEREETLWGEGGGVDREAEKMLSEGRICLNDGLSECEQDDEQSHFLQPSSDVDEKVNIRADLKADPAGDDSTAPEEGEPRQRVHPEQGPR
jgi:hypothetical protein